ncbi:15306_t:CDS:2, partial [Funneliformis caledonium]
MKYYKGGDLHSYLDETHEMLCLRDIIDMLWKISMGINQIYKFELIHRNLHEGSWITAICDEPIQSELSDQFDIAEEKKFSDLEKYKFNQQEIHPQAFY